MRGKRTVRSPTVTSNPAGVILISIVDVTGPPPAETVLDVAIIAKCARSAVSMDRPNLCG